MLAYSDNLCFHKFDREVDRSTLPPLFTYPFAYVPHPLTIEAVQIVESQLVQPIMEKGYRFGLEGDSDEMGKMFGVLIVESSTKEIGFLAAFSGKIRESNHLPGFVPPVFDILDKDGFYKQGESEINIINQEIIRLESSVDLKELEDKISSVEHELNTMLVGIIQENELKKQHRKSIRSSLLTKQEFFDHQLILKQLDQESKTDNLTLKRFKKHKRSILSDLQSELSQKIAEINQLKQKRKALSAQLQKGIFQRFEFLNILGETKSLEDIFSMELGYAPPSGSGECAGPKLLQYAFKYAYKPIAMAEFWWGAAPASEIRKHQHFYPACRSKCEPILSHMLMGLPVDKHPMLFKPYGENITLEILYEDEDIVAIHKPEGFLSVPGKQIIDSVQLRLQKKYGEQHALLVHRLDMSTSGIMLIAKNKSTHEDIQQQFIARTIHKKYIALLDGRLHLSSGIIELPIRVDLDNRPRQLVCYEYGKMAVTKFEKIGVEDRYTRIAFYPITGRTHQLRVHAAHHLGLNIPILGDDLYGHRKDRLYLHATSITFKHPASLETLTIDCPPPF